MKCVTPMFREYIEYTPEQKKRLKEQGTKQYQRIVPRKQVLEQLVQEPNSIRTLDQINKELQESGSPLKWQTIPCKHCFACQLNYSAEWATRIMCECQSHTNNYFITLTYNDTFLPIPEKMTLGNEVKENDGTWTTGTLHPEHVTKFINSLRKHYERINIKRRIQGLPELESPRYFYCGEYGETTQRPHYHMILFGAELDPKDFYDFHIDERKKLHWKSREIEYYWGQEIEGKMYPYGMIDIAECEWSCAAYVARYCMKKLMQEPKSDRWYFENGKEKEFVRMSRRPGIGSEYFEKHHLDIYSNDEMVMKTVKGHIGAFKPPKAFDKKFEELYPEEYEKLKISRQEAAKRAAEIERSVTDYTDLKMLEIKEQNISIKAKQLPRLDF